MAKQQPHSNQLERIMGYANAGKQLYAPTKGMQEVVNADGTKTSIPYMEDRHGRRTVMTREGPQVIPGYEGKNLYGDIGGKLGNVLGGMINKGRLGRQERMAEKSVAQQEIDDPTFVGPRTPSNLAELEKARERMNFEMPKEKIDYFDMSGVGQKKAVGKLVTAPNQTSVYQNTFPDGRVTWQDPNTGTIIFDSATMGPLPANAGGQPPSTSNRSGVFKPPPKDLTPDQQAAERIHGDPNVTVDGRVVNGVKTTKMSSAQFLAALRKKGEAGREGPEAKLRGEYTKNTDEFSKIDSAFSRLQSSLTGTGAGDLSLVFQYMKILDPGSTVREGEFANAANAGGVDDQIIGTYNKLMEGAFLSPMQRIDFYQRAKDLYGSAAQKYDYTTDMFTGLAEAYDITGANLNKIIYRRDSQRDTGSKLSNLLDGLTDAELAAFDTDELLQKGGQSLLDEVADYIEERKQRT